MRVCSLNVLQRQSQLFCILRIHRTPSRLHSTGLRPDPICARCNRDVGDLIHFLWRWPKLHCYWNAVVTTLNIAFQVSFPLDPRQCILSILDVMIPDVYVREAATRTLFQARRLILLQCISSLSPTSQLWLEQIGSMLRIEKMTYQHRGSFYNFEKV